MKPLETFSQRGNYSKKLVSLVYSTITVCVCVCVHVLGWSSTQVFILIAEFSCLGQASDCMPSRQVTLTKLHVVMRQLTACQITHGCVFWQTTSGDMEIKSTYRNFERQV